MNDFKVDHDFAKLILNQIPDDKWDIVCNELINNMIDDMPSDIMASLFNSKTAFEEAEEFLFDYYRPVDMHLRLITDALSIYGEVSLLYMLDTICTETQNFIIEQ